MIVIDGIYYAAALAAGGALTAWLAGTGFGVPLWLLAAFCLYFFRDPDRAIPTGPVAVSPADGKVVAVQREGPSLERISIFLNIFDVHVNRAPIAGAIANVQYREGRFHVASREACSNENEQNVVTMEGEGAVDGSRVVF
ncbi:MAG TPA: phosphatidylserine decarboxylase, partial [Bryobacteraceae bacterium]|nr:phosphatidylserine decarboxylase [Bryobacteraceae bacterium]